MMSTAAKGSWPFDGLRRLRMGSAATGPSVDLMVSLSNHEVVADSCFLGAQDLPAIRLPPGDPHLTSPW